MPLNLQIVSSRGTSIIRIVTEARDPQLAADLANTLAQTFIEQSIEARQRSAQQTFASLSGDLKDIRNRALQTGERPGWCMAAEKRKRRPRTGKPDRGKQQ